MEWNIRTIVWILGRIGCVAGDIENGAHDGYVDRIRRVGACPISHSISQNEVQFPQMRYMAVVPSHLLRSLTLIGSSLGGLSSGGSLGANFLGVGSWTCPVSAMADVCGIFIDEIII